MKYIDSDNLDQLPGRRLAETETFTFDCHPKIACFNRCCRNLNLFLYPYDVLRLKNRLGLTSGRFLDQYADVVLREGCFFPDMLLKMRDAENRPCLFLSESGCSIYPDRPDTCRKFPMEQVVMADTDKGACERIYLFRPPEFCRGPQEEKEWTPADWNKDRDTALYDKMTLRWAGLRRLLENDPWNGQGPEGPKAKMTFTAAYNIDGFREFVFESSFLKRYKLKSALLKKIRQDDVALLTLGFAWIQFYLWGRSSKLFRLRKS